MRNTWQRELNQSMTEQSKYDKLFKEISQTILNNIIRKTVTDKPW